MIFIRNKNTGGIHEKKDKSIFYCFINSIKRLQVSNNVLFTFYFTGGLTETTSVQGQKAPFNQEMEDNG